MLNRRRFLAASIAASPLVQTSSAQPNSHNTFAVEGDHFLLNGRPFQIISGEMHYPRVPRSCWRDRFRKARALGLNTICTYCFWNVHEPEPGHFDFSGNLDVASFIKMAQEEGLWIILRPGPYVCAEWDFGGFPAWLLADPSVHVRSTDPKFLQAAATYVARLAKEVVPLQISQGGPIILCQVENEYGSYGADQDYKNAIRKMFADVGLEPKSFYTADGPSLVPRGAFADLPAVINFGADENAAKQFATLDKLRPSGPRMCGEYWVGWFDHWGETHNGMTVKDVTAGLDWMLSHGVSVNLYMFHGGSSFGFMAGANYGKVYQPDVSSYDYDAPLDEAGRPTDKYFAIRDMIRRTSKAAAATNVPVLPEPEPFVTVPRFILQESASLWSLLGEPKHAVVPQTMEALGQSYGLLLYRTRVNSSGKGFLEIADARDYALVFSSGRLQGVLDRRLKQTRMPLDVPSGSTLDILIDVMGRVNFGHHLADDRKGILGNIFVDGAQLKDWDIFCLPLTNLSLLQFSEAPATGPAFYRGDFNLDRAGYTFLDTRGWGKGYVWVNGHNLGRYWSVGPQRTLYAPAEWLHSGRNEIMVLDLHDAGERSMEGVKDPIYDLAARARES